LLLDEKGRKRILKAKGKMKPKKEEELIKMTWFMVLIYAGLERILEKYDINLPLSP